MSSPGKRRLPMDAALPLAGEVAQLAHSVWLRLARGLEAAGSG